MSDEYRFPAATLVDALGTKIVFAESRKQDGCAVLRVEPRISTEPEAALNRTTAMMLKLALTLWIEHLDQVYVVSDEEDIDD